MHDIIHYQNLLSQGRKIYPSRTSTTHISQHFKDKKRVEKKKKKSMKAMQIFQKNQERVCPAAPDCQWEPGTFESF